MHIMSLAYRVAAAALALAAILPGQVRAQDKMRIAVSSDSLFHVPVYAAHELGYFSRLGLQTQTINTNSGGRSIAAVMSGDADIVIGAPASFVTAHAAGGDIILFAGEATQYGVNIIVTKKWADEHGFSEKSTYREKAAMLKGVTIGTTAPGGGNDTLTRYVAMEAGLNPDRDMTIVSLGEASAMLAAYSQGRVQALAVSSPSSNMAIRNFGGVMLVNTNVGEVPSLNGFLGSGVAGRGEWLAKNEQAAINFIKGMQMAFDAMHDPARTDQVREVVQKSHYAQTEPALFAELWKDLARGAPKSPEVTRAMVQTLVDLNNRFAKDKIDAKAIDGSFTNEYVEKARAQMK